MPLYDYWRDPGGAYLVMRLMRGGSLEAALRSGPLPLASVVRVLDQIGSALAAAHREGVIHRDLKPANVLLDEDGNAYLSDFGIAKAVGPEAQTTATGVIVGDARPTCRPSRCRAGRLRRRPTSTAWACCSTRC